MRAETGKGAARAEAEGERTVDKDLERRLGRLDPVHAAFDHLVRLLAVDAALQHVHNHVDRVLHLGRVRGEVARVGLQPLDLGGGVGHRLAVDGHPLLKLLHGLPQLGGRGGGFLLLRLAGALQRPKPLLQLQPALALLRELPAERGDVGGDRVHLPRVALGHQPLIRLRDRAVRGESDRRLVRCVRRVLDPARRVLVRRGRGGWAHRLGRRAQPARLHPLVPAAQAGTPRRVSVEHSGAVGEWRAFAPRPELLEADLDLLGPVGPLDHGGLVVALAVVDALEDLHGVPDLQGHVDAVAAGRLVAGRWRKRWLRRSAQAPTAAEDG